MRIHNKILGLHHDAFYFVSTMSGDVCHLIINLTSPCINIPGLNPGVKHMIDYKKIVNHNRSDHVTIILKICFTSNELLRTIFIHKKFQKFKFV